ncbi:MAG: hypothetical protein WC412_03790 [Candidatus Omnitrophota bacterium]
MLKPKRAIALILSLFVLIVLGGFVSLATYQYVADRVIHQHYENGLRGLYALETARNILLWEENHGPAVNNWDTDTTSDTRDTYDSTIRFPIAGAAITENFYSFSDNGFNIKAKVNVVSGNVHMYIQVYKGDAANPQEAQYLECIHSPSPMYKYAMFSNKSLTFSGSKLYDLKGGSVHSNGDLVFQPSSYGIRFNNMAQMTASGTIKYDLRYQYPAPHILDKFDAQDTNGDGVISSSELAAAIDGMAPAPSLNSNHYETTTGEAISPGPFRYWSTDTNGVTSLAGWSYASYVAGNWGNYGSSSYPLIFRGDETYFYGKQTNYGSYYPDASERTYSYLRSDGTYGGYNSSLASTVNRYYLSESTLHLSTSTSGYYQGADVYFKPYTTSDGSSNSAWFELPGSLPQSYTWDNKYVSSNSTENPVTFYVTESCATGSASCNASAASGTPTTGWRYVKEDKDGNACTTDDCYNDAGGVHGSDYVKAQDYETGEITSDMCYSKCNYSAVCDGDEVYKCDDDCYDVYYQCYYACRETDYYKNYIACYYACTDSACRLACRETEDYLQYKACYDPCVTNRDSCEDTCWAACSACYDNCSANPDNIKYYDKMFSYYSSGSYHVGSGTSYAWSDGFDANSEFKSDYSYGGDIVAGKSTSQTTAFNSQKQPEGFTTYLDMLSQKNITGVIDSGVDKKNPYLGNLFYTTSTGDSAYKIKAQAAGIYLNGTKSPSDIVNALNSGLEAGEQFASEDTFYNWKTEESITVVNIDVGKMKAAINSDKVSFSNGVLYSEVPVMLSNANDLPGTSSGDKTAVFTLVSEESVYLKGDYNTQNWKISNIATDKRVYTLSDAFSANTLPDPTVYINYPYIKVSVTKDINGKIVSYNGISGDQTSATGANEVWVNADYVDDTYTTTSGADYSYYQGMGDTLRGDIQTKRTSLQSTYVAEHTDIDGTTTFPNNVDKSSYSYNSLFVTPYDIETLENWKYQSGTEPSGKAIYTTASRSLVGAFINFSNCATTSYSCEDDYKAKLTNEEYCTTTTCSGGFSYRDRQAPKNSLSSITSPSTVQSYDGNFPTASPTSNEGVLGFTGQNSWRPISKEYFKAKTEE